MTIKKNIFKAVLLVLVSLSVISSSGNTYWRASGEYDYRDVRWSPDGKKISFVYWRFPWIMKASPHLAYFLFMREDTIDALYIMNPDGSDVRKMAGRIAHYAWSPDGEKILFTTRGGRRHNELIIVDIKSRRRKVLAKDISRFKWSPDGKKILYTERGKLRIGHGGCGRQYNFKYTYIAHVINSDGTGDRKLPGKVGRCSQWSPDGKRIAYTKTVYMGTLTTSEGKKVPWLPSKDVVFIIDADGTNDREVIDGNCRSWSPDGTKIAFTKIDKRVKDPRFRKDHPGIPYYSLNLINPDGTNKVGPLPGGADQVTWSPDGTKIIVSRSPEKSFVINSDGSNKIWLLDYISHRTWSPSSKKIYFTKHWSRDEEKGLFIVDADGKNVKKLFGGSMYTSIDRNNFSPDGKRLAFKWKRQIYVIDIESKEIKKFNPLNLSRKED